MSLINADASPIGSRMGRPPLGNIATNVRLPREVMDRIDALCGQNRRAVFIREAVAEKLAREEEELDKSKS